MMYNRKTRREIAKNMGFLKSQDKLTQEDIDNGTTKQQKRLERTRRAKEMGDKLMTQHLEEQINKEEKEDAEREARELNNLIESGHTEKEANEIMANGRATQRERQAELLKRKIKRGEA